ncbi:MAG: 3-phosphoshikimate 1-carboxyvinyltransferase [Thermodesulfobacteriota bacterium]
MIRIMPTRLSEHRVRVPGSKSYTHRALIASALGEGLCTITDPLFSQDTLLTAQALKQMGIPIEQYPDAFVVRGKGGRITGGELPIDLGNSGTSMRLLTAVATLSEGPIILTGNARMQERPINDLLDGLHRLGIQAVSLNRTGCPPVRISGGPLQGGVVEIDCSRSSQFLSALLLVAPCTPEGMRIRVVGDPVSKPYIDMTLGVMKDFGIAWEREGYSFFVPGGQLYRRASYAVEPDASNAGYFWAAAAITRSRITVEGISLASTQGDVRFVRLLKRMGCRVTSDDRGLTVEGYQRLQAIDVDMSDMPDLVPTLAVVASIAEGKTIVRNVAHLRIKESDRLAVTIENLARMGIRASSDGTDLEIVGGAPHGALIETADDHRMAMSFALVGLVTEGIRIGEEDCVGKSFPNFWGVLQSLGVQIIS